MGAFLWESSVLVDTCWNVKCFGGSPHGTSLSHDSCRPVELRKKRRVSRRRYAVEKTRHKAPPLPGSAGHVSTRLVGTTSRRTTAPEFLNTLRVRFLSSQRKPVWIPIRAFVDSSCRSEPLLCCLSCCQASSSPRVKTRMPHTRETTWFFSSAI